MVLVWMEVRIRVGYLEEYVPSLCHRPNWYRARRQAGCDLVIMLVA
jgi:hypothetical protein